MDSSKGSILVIDDHERIVKAIQVVLEKKGFDVLTAPNGWTGLKLAREEKPDLIILDIMMPVMDGYEVCRRLGSEPDTAAIPVLMLSGKGRIEGISPDVDRRLLRKHIQERLDGFSAGAVEFLSKPIRAKELVESVRKLLTTRSFGG